MEDVKKDRRGFLKNEYLLAKNAAHRATSWMFPFILFGAFLSMVAGWMTFLPGSLVYYYSYFTLQFFYVFFVGAVCFKLIGMNGVPAGITLAAYFAFFHEGGVAGSGNLGYLGYMLMAFMLAFSIKYLNMFWLKVLPPLEKGLKFLLRKIAGAFVKKEDKREGAFKTTDGLIDELRKLGDWLIRMLVIPALAGLVILIVFFYGVAGPIESLSNTVAEYIIGLDPSKIVLAGAVIGIICAIDFTGPLGMGVFLALFSLLKPGDAYSAQLMTIFAVCLVTPTFVCILLYVLQLVLKRKWPLDFEDENFAMTAIINSLFTNFRLTTAAPMLMALRDPFTAVPGFIAGGAVTGIVAASMDTTNMYYTSGYLEVFGEGGSQKIFTEGYDALVGMKDVLYSGSAIGGLLAAVLAGGLAGALVIFALRAIKYPIQNKMGLDIYMAYGAKMPANYKAYTAGHTAYSEAGWEITPVEGDMYGAVPSVSYEVDRKYIRMGTSSKTDATAYLGEPVPYNDLSKNGHTKYIEERPKFENPALKNDGSEDVKVENLTALKKPNQDND